MSTTILLIRHATTPKVGKGLTGWLPGVSLDDEGRQQAEMLVSRLRHLRIDAIYSSPLERTQETAAPLAKSRQLPILLKREFGEIDFGEWQGKDFSQIELDPQWTEFNSYRSGTRAPGGELMLEAQARMVSGILGTISTHLDETVAVFSHADAIKSALFHFLGIPLDFHMRLEISPASVTTVEFSGAVLVLRSINSTGSVA